MGFHQSQMSRQVLFLHTEMNPAQRMLKPTYQLSQLEDEDSDIYLQTKFQTYLKRPSGLYSLTYPEFYRWWRSATSAEQRKAESEHADDAYSLNSKGSDDFSEFMCAKTTRDGAQVQLSELLDECEVNIRDAQDFLALSRALTRLAVPQRVIDCVQQYYVEQGIEPLPKRLHQCPTEASYQVAEAVLECIDLEDSDLINALCTHHWLMDSSMREELITVLTHYKPGSVLADTDGHHWYRRAKMVCTRHRFISSVGDDQEKYYEQKYLLTVPLIPQSEVVLEPPRSWVEFCARQGMCDEHVDALSCMQSAVVRGFHTEALRQLPQLYVQHGFLADDEADLFLSEIPVLGEREEPETAVADQLLQTVSSDMGDLVPSVTPTSLSDMVQTFTESQLRAFHWVARSAREWAASVSGCHRSCWYWQVLPAEGSHRAGQSQST